MHTLLIANYLKRKKKSRHIVEQDIVHLPGDGEMYLIQLRVRLCIETSFRINRHLSKLLTCISLI